MKWFDATKGFGFIAGDAGGKDIFVHVSVLRNAGLQQLKRFFWNGLGGKHVARGKWLFEELSNG
ncbi:MAG: cold shock domain-containing protein [Actinomycetes bacterium]